MGRISAIIQGAQVEVLDSSTLGLTRKEGGNYGFIIVRTSTDVRYQPLEPVLITLDETEHQFLIQKPERHQVGVNRFVHHLSLFDTLHCFDVEYTPDRTFTKVGQTVRDVLEVYTENYVDNSLLDTLMPNKEYAGLNKSTILEDIYRRIAARPIAKLQVGADPLLDFVQYTKRVGNAVITPNYSKIQDDQDASSYASTIIGKVKNAIIEDGRGTWFPSRTGGGVGIRTEDYRLDESTAAFLLDSNIWDILSVELVDAAEYYSVEEPGLEDEPQYADLDITDFVFRKDEWQFLRDPIGANEQGVISGVHPATFEYLQSNSIYYEWKTNRITGLWDTHPFRLDRQRLNTLWICAFSRWSEIPIEELGYDRFLPSRATKMGDSNSADWQNLRIRVKYIAQRDIDYIVEKMNVDTMFKSTILSNQLSSQVDLGQHIDGLSILAERTGNVTRTFEQVFQPEETLYALGNFTTDDFVITTIKYTVNGGRVSVEGELEQNFASIDVTSSVSREPYPFVVTPRNVRTNMITKDFLELSLTSKGMGTDIGDAKHEQFRRTALNIFAWDADDNLPIDTAHMRVNTPFMFAIEDRTDGWRDKFGPLDLPAFHMPVMSFGGNSIVMQVQFMHPTIGGFALNNGTMNQKLREALKYVDDDEFLSTYLLRLGVTSNIEEDTTDKHYPIVRLADIMEGDPATYIKQPLRELSVNVKLDANSILQHTHEMLICTDSTQIVLNGNLGRFNNLINDIDSEPNFRVYYSSTDVNKFTHTDKVIRSSDIFLSTATITYDHSLRRLRVQNNTPLPKNFAIVLNLSHILFAINRPAVTGTQVDIFFNFLDDRSQKRDFQL